MFHVTKEDKIMVTITKYVERMLYKVIIMEVRENIFYISIITIIQYILIYVQLWLINIILINIYQPMGITIILFILRTVFL